MNWVLVGFALLCSLAIQFGTNLVNDAIDFKKGADGEGRLGPQRMTQGGFLSFKQVLTAGILCFVFALLCGIPLIAAGGWPILLVLSIAVACGYFYTGGPFPLAYTGLRDLFVLIFFGWVSTGILEKSPLSRSLKSVRTTDIILQSIRGFPGSSSAAIQ